MHGSHEHHEDRQIHELLCQIVCRLDKLEKTQENFMKEVQDFVAKEQADLASINAKLDSVVVGIKALDDLIQNFQNSPGTLSVEDQTALDAVSKASTDLVAKSSAIDTTPPVGPTL